MHLSALDNPPSQPAQLCGYRVERTLTPGQSYLAAGPGGRAVVLKRVDDDCMLGAQLHPSIKERPSRVRELAHGGVANLHGVARDQDAAWLIWEHVPGLTFAEYLADVRRTPLDMLNLARDLILAVDSLHGQGIVHGALIESNLIISPQGVLKLVHISPLLYSDPAVDVECAIALLQDAVERRGENDSPLGRTLEQAVEEKMSLRALAARIAALLEVREGAGAPDAREEERHLRRRTVLAAGVLGFLALILAYGIWRATDGSAESHPPRWPVPSQTTDK